MNKMVCFDMDGTIADLYGVNGWLEYLQAENPWPYLAARPDQLAGKGQLRGIQRRCADGEDGLASQLQLPDGRLPPGCIRHNESRLRPALPRGRGQLHPH